MKKFLIGILIPFVFCSVTIATFPSKLFIGVTSDKPVYKTGEPIAIALTILNQKSTSYKATFTSSKKFDFRLYNGDHLVWKWSASRMFLMSLSILTLKPKQPVTYVITFNQKLPNNQPIKPGRYKLVGSFCLKKREYFSKPIEIEIRK